MTEVFRDLPYMGVIYVVVEAMKLGYSPFDPKWANLGQGMPEIGPIEGAPPRIQNISMDVTDHAYGPVEGLPELKAKVAEHYNRLYRVGLSSQYTAENVVIASGGRTTLTRAFAAFDKIRLGYFIPDYTAYEDLLTTFLRVTPVLIELEASNGFSITPAALRERIKKDKLDALLISNPCNPTGLVIEGKELEAWVDLSRETQCSLVLDEYYSHYHFSGEGPVSSARYIEDVNKDPVFIIDGLTKNYRYPGWRVGWGIGPKNLISRLTAAGSFIDGGPPRPMQRAALQALEPDRADQETNAVRAVFRKKRDLMVETLKRLGIEMPCQSQGTFYAFGSTKNLPEPLRDGMQFFRQALEYKVLTVPGAFFDVNPFKERKGDSPLKNFVRFSFGPPFDIMKAGLERLEQMVKAYS